MISSSAFIKNGGKGLKFGCVVLCTVILALSAGCSYSDYKEPENRTFVSAVAVDSKKGKLQLTAELIRIRENLNNDEYTVATISGEGSKPEDAMLSLIGKNSKELNFSHCAVLCLGSGLSDAQLCKMLQYWFHKRTLTLSVQLVAAQEGASLFFANEDGEKPVGYEISEMIKNYNGNAPKIPKCRLLDFINAQNDGKKSVRIPFFAVKKSKNGTQFYPDGAVCITKFVKKAD